MAAEVLDEPAAPGVVPRPGTPDWADVADVAFGRRHGGCMKTAVAGSQDDALSLGHVLEFFSSTVFVIRGTLRRSVSAFRRRCHAHRVPGAWILEEVLIASHRG